MTLIPGPGPAMLAPPDIEGAVVTLYSGLADSVGTRLPSTLPDTAIRVTRAGGGSLNLIQTRPRLLVECFAPDSVAAFDLARLAYAHLWASGDSFIAPGVWVTEIELTDPVNFPDSSAKRARYQFLAQMTTSLTEA